MRHTAHDRHGRSGRQLPSSVSFGKRAVALLLAAALLAPTSASAGAVAEGVRGTWSLAGATPAAAEPPSAPAGNNWTLPLGLNPSPAAPPRRPPTKAEREERVARIEMIPSESVATAGRPVELMAIPLDSAGQAVQGLAAEWASSDPRVVKVTKAGDAVALSAGTAYLTAKAGRKAASVRVAVVEKPPAEQFGAGKISSTRGGGAAARPKAFRARLNHSAVAAAPSAFLSEDTLPDDETASLYEPANDVGRPPNRTEPGAAEQPAAFPGTETPASENFSMSVPLVNLSGRGPAVTLALSYNSRLWHESFGGDSKAHLTYDVDSGWPAPGFRLGYGQMESQGASDFTLIDPDGTRHQMARRTATQPDYDSVDGTFIQFRGGREGGVVTYTDGTRVRYAAAGTGNRSYPVRITDRNGNYISIGYVGGVGPRILAIQDTMARYVHFHYDGPDLSSITVPKYDGTKTQETTVVRFFYGPIDFAETPHAASALFNSQNVTPHHPDTARLLRYVMFHGTGSGYRYDYSGYAMIRQVVQLRAMQPSSFDLTPSNENVTGDGQWAATTTYDYPQWAVPLSGVPTYSTRTDDWAGRTSVQPVQTFGEGFDFSRVTAPDGTVTETKMLTGAGADLWKNGLVGETLVKAENGAVRSSTKYDWDPTSRNNPRVKKVWITNEAGQTRATVYNEYDAYNNVLSVSEHDFAAAGTVGTELRRTEVKYVTDERYLSRRLLHLPEWVRVVDAADDRVASLVKYFYDGTSLLLRGAEEVFGHDQAYNPEAPQRQVCNPSPQCDPDDFECGCRWEEQYDQATAFRGNLTTVRAYPDAQTPVDADATASTVRYDILGNPVEQTVNCCRKKTFTYTAGYHYAYPEKETRGEGALQLSTSAVYDFNTGLARISRDENEQETTFFYDVDTHRPVTVLRPGGGRTDFHYHDALLLGPGDLPRYSRETTVTTFETGRTSESSRYFDGRGSFVRALGSFTAAQGWVTVDIEYDRTGRAFRASNPYYGTGEKNAINPSNLWTTNTEYDNFGRATEVTLPDGGKVLKNYAGTVITTTDPAGRQRRIVWDALGRAAELHEPDEDGNLGTVASPAQKTSYEYDVLSNMTKVTQAGSFRGGPPVTQVRQFRYDSLSRLTHQRQVEETARLNDDGAVSDAGHWTTVLKYDTWGNLTDAYDALGVHSSIEYDTLNRPKSVTYFGETGAATPRVTYTYDQARTDASGEPYFNKGELTSVATDGTADAPATRHDYDYDRAGQIVAQRQTVGAQTYSLAYEYNLAGQLRKQTYPSGRVVAHTYDDAARLVSAAGGAKTYASSVSYAAHGGTLGVVLGSGTTEVAEYNSRLQPTSLMLKVGSGAATKVIQQYAYKYGLVNQTTGDVDETKNAGQVARVDGFIGGSPSAPVKQWEQRLSYDSIGRLAAAAEKYGQGMSQQSWRNRYSYDRWGNRYQEEAEQSQPLPYMAVEVGDVDRSTNRLAAPTQTSVGVEYDYAGQIIRDTKFRALSYDYDAKGRQVSASHVDGTNEVRSTYDALGQRVRTAFGAQERVYVYDITGRVVAEYGPPEPGQGGTKYVFADTQGSTRVVMDDQGVVRARRDYAPFGGEIGAGVGPRTGAGPGGQSYGVAEGTRQQYALTDKDAETGLDHTLWRKYDNLAGRWTSPDPYGGSMNVGDPQSFNRYAYVGNDPANFVDPAGLNRAGPNTRYGYCPPGSAVCGSGVGMGALQALDGFNFFYFWNGEGYSSDWIHQESYGSMFTPPAEENGGGTSQESFTDCRKAALLQFKADLEALNPRSPGLQGKMIASGVGTAAGASVAVLTAGATTVTITSGGVGVGVAVAVVYFHDRAVELDREKPALDKFFKEAARCAGIKPGKGSMSARPDNIIIAVRHGIYSLFPYRGKEVIPGVNHIVDRTFPIDYGTQNPYIDRKRR